MKTIEIIFGVLKIPLDALAAVAALLAAYRLREANIDLLPWVQLLNQSPSLPDFEWYLSSFVVWAVLLFLIIAAFVKLYSLTVTFGAWNEIGRIILAAVLWIALVIAWYFLVEKQLFFSRVLLLHATFLIILFVTIERAALLLFQRGLLKRGYGVRSVISVGGHAVPESVYGTLDRDTRYDYLGHFPNEAEFKAFHRAHHIDLVLHTDADVTNDETASIIEYCRSRHIGYAFLPSVFTDAPHQLLIEHLGVVPLLRFQPTPLDGWGRVLKRIFDFVISLILIIVLSPILLVLGLLILLFSGWPIFYISKRIGQHARKNISVLKFRTMHKNADDMKESLKHLNHRDGPLFKIKNDPRVTSIGKILRKLTLDELPQLINVLIGDMSLVGPRPHLPNEVDLYNDYQRRVFAVKPGMTGLAQVAGRSDLQFEEEMKLDMRYVEEWSLWLDMWILWRTIFTVFKGNGAD